jgi:hypothetical protein
VCIFFFGTSARFLRAHDLGIFLRKDVLNFSLNFWKKSVLMSKI